MRLLLIALYKYPYLLTYIRLDYSNSLLVFAAVVDVGLISESIVTQNDCVVISRCCIPARLCTMDLRHSSAGK